MINARPRPIVSLLAFILYCAGASCFAAQAAQPPAPPTPSRNNLSAVVASARIDLTAATVRSSRTARLALRTPDGRLLTLIRTSQERIGEAGIAWSGRLADEALAGATIVENRGALAGMIFSRAGTYRVRSGRDGVYLEQLDPRRFPPEGRPIERPGLRDKRADPAADTCATDSGDNIDVLVAYTDDARAAAGGVAQMEAEVYLAVAVSNQSYVNSNITQRLRLVHMVEVDYAETGDADTDLPWLRGNASLQTLRNTFAADTVVMLTETLDYCGLAYFMSSVGNAFNPDAYGVVMRSCASGNLSFPHELGHNMSATHDWNNDTGTSPYTFIHGFQRPIPSVAGTQPWRTVMAYACADVTCGRIPYWSNPNVFYPGPTGDPTGVSGDAQPADNAQVLNLTALTVANFRCSSRGRGDVWMKDRWNDTGAQPEPLTAGQPMWESPYIWVRNNQDTTLVHQHQHEDPTNNQQNWAYVKLHSGASTNQSGTLHLYYGDASTGLVWPGSFTEIGSVAVTMAPHSSRVVEIPWPNVPGPGHYCLVARWVSATDPMIAEGNDINANTIANNNIVWRNLNILAGDELDRDVSLIVRNPDPRNRTITNLRFHLPRNANGLSFANYGEVTFEIEPRLVREAGAAFRPSALTGRQGRWTLQRGAEIAELRGLVLPQAPRAGSASGCAGRRPARPGTYTGCGSNSGGLGRPGRGPREWSAWSEA